MITQKFNHEVIAIKPKTYHNEKDLSDTNPNNCHN